MESKRRNMERAVVLIIACAFIIYGITRNETAVVLNKAVNICLECIGIG
ncbi:MAG: CD1871A family CXXC motif-containing protein [Lachnospiraceae bacterium]|nr:CD1871A family CXXC motif-containing protein [Lachnospiraceae bacterium]